jgi:ubiquinone biosynthesis protein
MEIPNSNLGARHLLRLSAYAVALYRCLVEQGVDPEITTGLVSDAVFRAISPGRDAIAWLARRRHREVLAGARWASDLARRLYYAEPGWHIKDVPTEDGFGFDVTRCVVAEYFDRLDESELCERIICVQDTRSAARHGIRLVRSETLAGGGDRCDFRYRARSSIGKEGAREDNDRHGSH